MSNWIWLLIALAVGAVFIWWVWGRGAAPVDKPTTPAQPLTPPAQPAAKAIEPTPETPAKPLAFTGEIPAQEPPLPVTPIAKAPEPKAPPAAKAPAAKKVPAKKPAAKPAPAAKKAAAPAAKVAKAPAAKPPAVKAPAKPKAAPKVAAKPAAPDNLLQLKGVGPKLVTLLNGLGVNSFAQIAAWTPADVERVDAQLGTFKGRVTRDLWIEQAGYLAKGDVKSFEAKFGKLDSEN